MWRRLQVRQAQLFSLAGKVNPEYFGARAQANLDANLAADLRDLVGNATLDPASTVQRVQVQDAGVSSLTTGDRIAIVSLDDIAAEEAPRMTLRDFVLRTVGTDLTGVVSICVAYSRVPNVVAAANGTEILALPDQYHELLVIDLAVDLLKKTIGLGVEQRVAAISVLEQELAPLLADFQSEVAVFPEGASHRFSEPPPTTRR